MPSSGPDFDHERQIAVAAAQEAGRLLRSRFGTARCVRTKGGSGDVLMDLDLAAEKLVLRRLQHHFPHDRILSEEAGLLDAAGERTWLVDPLDGSNNVVIGLPTYAVGIGLCLGGTPVMGVVHEPVTGRPGTRSGDTGPTGRPALCPAPAARCRAPGPSSPGRRDTPWNGATRAPWPCAQCWSCARRRVLQLWAPLLGWSLLARGTIDAFVGYRAEGVDLPTGALLAAEAGVELRTLSGAAFSPGFAGADTGRSFVAARGETLAYLLADVGAVTRDTA